MECGEETEFYPTISDLLEFAARAASLNRRVITVNVVSTDSLVRVSLNCPLRPNVISGEQRNWVVAQKVKHDNLLPIFVDRAPICLCGADRHSHIGSLFRSSSVSRPPPGVCQ
eukprot:Selendium_serpulae@DN5672_c0_g1_i2.p1